MDTAPEIFAKLSQDVIQGPIRFRPESHEYFHIPTNKKLAAVSRVIQTVYSTKSWDGVNPEIVENAAARGKQVDRYLAQCVRDGFLDLPAPEDNFDRDVNQRTKTAARIWEEEFSGLPAVFQKIVYSLQDGIAGTMDFWVDESIVCDLKCTYRPEKSWILQLGAYCNYAPAPVKRAGVIHVAKAGGLWMEYSPLSCMAYWRDAVEWWKKTQSMKR